ncbi:MAG: lactonase family protein [Treponema sp.]|jgi:6-phosphogluconolactonase|nr:lactonase family protein [Treponema sp.]
MIPHMMVYAGTYQDQHWFSDMQAPHLPGLLEAPAHGVGIGRYSLDLETGELMLLGYTAADNNPATLRVSPDQKYLYVAHETKNFDNVKGAGGGVSAYSIDQTNGDLRLINIVSSCGTFPAHITVDRAGRFVVVANHASYFYNTRFHKTEDGDYRPEVLRDVGSLVLFAVREDGGLEEACDLQAIPGRGYDVFNQMSAHPHGVEIVSDDYVIAPDKGADTVDVFKLDRENRKLLPVEFFPSDPGAAPRHAAVHPSSPFLFVINEFNNKVVSYRWDRGTGKLTEIQQSFTVPPQFVGKSYTSCDIKIHPNGRFMYLTNNPPYASIAAFVIDGETGRMTLMGNYREIMRNFREINIDPTGKYMVGGGMANDRMFVYKIDPETGALRDTGKTAPALFPSCTHFARIG